MKKVLLVGVLNEIIRSLNECLMGDFQVQLCAAQLEDVQGMVKIIKPELVVFCGIGLECFTKKSWGYVVNLIRQQKEFCLWMTVRWHFAI